MNRADRVKAFALTNMLLESDLDAIEKEYSIDLGRKVNEESPAEAAYYSRFEGSLRREAASMASHYETFYCLEKTIRQLILDVFEDGVGAGWWDAHVPEAIRINAKKAMKREKESAVTPRSSEPLDYTTFGELGVIIKSNWDLFGAVFNDIKAMEKVMSNLNSLRNPIAHCAPLAEDEVLRLDLSLRDWFRILS